MTEPAKPPPLLITITSEEEAWRWLEAATTDPDFPAEVDLRFAGWPTFDLRVNGADWHSTVPSRIMRPMLDVQKDIYRAYTRIQYDTESLAKLTDREREQLELLLVVKAGSSDFKVFLEKQLTTIAEKCAAKMEGRHVVITVLGCALIWGGTEVGKQWIASQQESAKAEVTVRLSEQETARLQIVTAATKQQPTVADAKTDFESSQNRLLKAVKPDDKITLKGVELTGGQARDITHEERAHATERQIVGTFRILSNNTAVASGFRIKVARLEDGTTFMADVPLTLSTKERDLIKQAEWSKEYVRLDIRANILRDRVSDALVYRAREVPTALPEATPPEQL